MAKRLVGGQKLRSCDLNALLDALAIRLELITEKLGGRSLPPTSVKKRHVVAVPGVFCQHPQREGGCFHVGQGMRAFFDAESWIIEYAAQPTCRGACR